LLKDKKAFLTGRTLTLEVNPLDFEEYKLFKKIDVKQRDNILNESYFKNYMEDSEKNDENEKKSMEICELIIILKLQELFKYTFILNICLRA
jgi:predicted AAA+ superfamily ATPase